MIKLFNRFALYLFDNPGAYVLYYTVVLIGGSFATVQFLKLLEMTII